MLIGWVVATAGCGVALSTATLSTPQSILQAVKSRPDRTTLEIFQVRVPEDDAQFDEDLWQAVDEQRLDLALRNRLVSNGIRVGIISGALPDSLARSMNLQSEMPEDSNTRLVDEQLAAPRVTRRVLQLKHREPAAIKVTEPQSLVNVFVNSENGVQGRSYSEVEGVYAMQVESVPGQKIAVELVPELHFGEMKNRYAGSDQGIFVVTPSRERQVFDQLKSEIELSAGELLVLSGIPDTRGSLGDALHGSQLPGSHDQKLILIRLLEIPPSEILADAAP